MINTDFLLRECEIEVTSTSFQIKKERLKEGIPVSHEKLFGDGPWNKESAVKILDELQECRESTEGEKEDVRRPDEETLRVDTTTGSINEETVYKIQKVKQKKIVK